MSYLPRLLRRTSQAHGSVGANFAARSSFWRRANTSARAAAHPYASTHISPQALQIRTMAEFKAETALERALEECSNKFALEFRGGLHVHMHQGVVALYQLGVPEEEVLEFVKLSLESKAYEEVGAVNVEVTKENFWENCGRDNNDSFAALRKFFVETSHDKTWQELVREWAPQLMCSQANGLLHGLIQLGNGIEGLHRPNDMMVREGLAWLANGFFDLSPAEVPLYCHEDTKPAGVKCLDPISYIIDAFEAASKQDVPEQMRQKQAELGGKRVFFMAHKHHPEMEFYKVLEGTLVFDRDLDKLIEQVTVLTAAGFHAAGAEFFVLHCVTSWWALRFVLPHLPDDNARYEAIAQYIRASVYTWVFAFIPEIDDTTKLLKVLLSKEETEKHPLFQRFDSEPSDANWQQIIDEKARKVSGGPPDVEAHHPKVIHALYEDWKKYDYMPVFLEGARNYLKQDMYRNYDRVKEARDK